MAKSTSTTPAPGPAKAHAKVAKLDAVLTISHAPALRESLQKQLEKSPELHLSAAQVERITTPCIQLLLSADKSAAQAGGKLQLHTPSTVFTAAFESLGLSETLQRWSA